MQASENDHQGTSKQKNGCVTWKSLPIQRWRRTVCDKHHYRNEQWVYEFTPESKRKLNDFGKKNLTMFWNCQDLILPWIFLTKSKISIGKILQKLCKGITWKRPGWLTSGGRLLHFGPDSSLVAEQKWEVLQHPLYSLDLAPSDFLFGPFKNFYQRKDLRTRMHCKK